jgi:hypothetical protein
LSNFFGDVAGIRVALERIAAAAETVAEKAVSIDASEASSAAALQGAYKLFLSLLPIVGINPQPDPVSKGNALMGTKVKNWKVVKAGAGKTAPAAAPPTSGNFNLVANATTPPTWTIMGVSSDGTTLVPLPSTFSITVVSDTPANVLVGAITGATFGLTAPGVVGSTANVTLTATDSATPPTPGSPFTFDMICTIQSGGIIGINPVQNP